MKSGQPDNMKKRPELNSTISPDDFKNFYWLKAELVSFCRTNGICTTGGKIEITSGIEKYLATGIVVPTSGSPVQTSSFDWNNAELKLTTKLTDNYKNTENVRTFMTLHIGHHFKFNTEFMNWAKANTGKSMGEAIEEWKRIYTLKRNKGQKTEIAPQFEYNRYIRDFMADNPGQTLKSAIRLWKIKSRRTGDNKYDSNDLLFDD